MPRLVLRPLKSFLDTEASGGILLLVAAVAALLWVNSPWGDSYEELWHTTLTVRLGDLVISEDLRHWINDALMAIFFFVVGLEIKRELVSGELRDPRAAALPAFAALGGMIGPALIYAAINAGGPGSDGWGIPMATDIAFAVGVLALVGRRAPASLKLFLLSLAIVDDIGAILVIALFYTDSVSFYALGVAAALLLLIVGLQRAYVRAMPVYAVVAAGVWLAVFESGVHATIAGVVLGLMTPASPFQPPQAVSTHARRIADETSDDPAEAAEDVHHWLSLSSLSREAVAPLGRLEHLLHPWTSFVIVPLFALANAGVDLRGGGIGDAVANPVALGIIVGLVAGKIIGISSFAWLSTKIGLTRLPSGVRWSHIIAVSSVAGIGFTVSLFIAALAFSDADTLEAAKVGILLASVLAGILGAVLMLRASRRASEKAPNNG
ncbi:MAG TPA: Na+/H+ antiporter NhaA [Actinomycetota bacterium]|nr:Na+/H+ antiporter NhaA [Actinomycetota bacterium]